MAASSSDLAGQLESIIQCSICSEVYTDPRILPCVHTYCFECVRGFCGNRPTGDVVPCPLCRYIFTVPEGGVDGLPKNFLIEQLKDLRGKPRATTCDAPGQCDECKCSLQIDETEIDRCSADSNADSKKRLCGSCNVSCRPVAVDETASNEEIRGNVTAAVDCTSINDDGCCAVHRGEKLEVYCRDCAVDACLTCFFARHKTHECVETMTNGCESHQHQAIGLPTTALALSEKRSTSTPADPSSDDAIPPTPTLRHTVHVDEPVVGLTLIDGRLFMLRLPSHQQIQVYDTGTFTLQRTVRVVSQAGDDDDDDDARFWYGLASCDTDNCIYVSDSVRNLIYRVKLASDNRVRQWPVGNGPRGLSITAAGRVLVACCESNTIQEYTKKGSLVSEILLDASVTRPFHAVQLTCGQLVMSHHGQVSGVSVINDEGRVVVESRSTGLMLNRPGHLSVGRQGQVFAADSNNNRIVVFDASLSAGHELNVSRDTDVQEPWCVCLDESRGRLYVGEYDGQRILVFDNVFNDDALQ